MWNMSVYMFILFLENLYYYIVLLLIIELWTGCPFEAPRVWGSVTTELWIS